MILKSATKLVLIYMVLILGGIVAFTVSWDVVHNQFSEVTKVILGAFTSSVTYLFGYYFGSKSTTPPSTQSPSLG